MAINIHVSIITLNVNGLNALEREREQKTGLKKKRGYNMLPIRDPLQDKGYIQIEIEGDRKKIFHANRNDKNMEVTILLSDKIDCKIQAIKKDEVF